MRSSLRASACRASRSPSSTSSSGTTVSRETKNLSHDSKVSAGSRYAGILVARVRIRLPARAGSHVGTSRATGSSRQRPEHRRRLGPVEELGRLLTRQPAVVVVLPVECRLPAGRRLREERLDVDRLVDERCVEMLELGFEPRLLAQLAYRGLGERLALLHAARDLVPVRVVLRRAVDDEELLPAAHHDEHLLRPHAGKTTSARAPAKAKLPWSSSATSARTIESPVPLGAPSAPEPSSAIARRTWSSRRVSSIRTVPAPCSSAFWSSSEKTSASAVARVPASDTGSSCAWTSRPPPSPCTSIARSRSISSASSTSSSRCSVSASCTAAMARIRLTECSSASRGSTPSARACRRSSEATVWRLFFTRWWIS